MDLVAAAAVDGTVVHKVRLHPKGCRKVHCSTMMIEVEAVFETETAAMAVLFVSTCFIQACKLVVLTFRARMRGGGGSEKRESGRPCLE